MLLPLTDSLIDGAHLTQTDKRRNILDPRNIIKTCTEVVAQDMDDPAV